MTYLLDTNICIQLIRRKSPDILRRFLQAAPGELAVSSITVAELEFGVQKSQFPGQNAAALAQFLLPLEIVAFDHAAATVYGQVRATLERAGTPIGALDLLIAAHALSLPATLVTNNRREFARVPGLHVEDWTGRG